MRTRAPMFLFTTPSAPPRETTPANPVVDAIRDGASRTGTGFEYLLATAQRESGLDPAAKNGQSSATGLFQFIEQTWLGVVKTDGPRLGLANAADAIEARSDGTYAVPDPAARQAILDLRRDPTAAAAMAGALTQHNRDALAGQLGREPTRGDLYAAHVLGARGAADLIRTAQASPARTVASDMPEAASANRSLFYDRSGRARGAAEVYAGLTANQVAAAGASPAPAAATVTGVDAAGSSLPSDGPVLQSLFPTDARRGPVPGGAARLWGDRGGARDGVTSPAYFPRGDGAADSPARALPAPAAATVGAASPLSAETVPLPPRRPPELAGGAAVAVRRTVTPSDFSALVNLRR